MDIQEPNETLKSALERNFHLSTPHATLQTWLHPIDKHVVIQTKNWDLDDVEDDDFDEEYSEATIMLDKNRAVKLVEKLQQLIKVMAE